MKLEKYLKYGKQRTESDAGEVFEGEDSLIGGEVAGERKESRNVGCVVFGTKN